MALASQPDVGGLAFLFHMLCMQVHKSQRVDKACASLLTEVVAASAAFL